VSLRLWSIFLVLCVFWGIPYFFIKLALTDLSPACVAWTRITLGALVVVPIAWHRGVLQPALRRIGPVAAFALAELVIPFPLVSLAETWISSSLTGVLIAAAPLMVVGFAPLFGIRESLGIRRSFGLLIGFAGVLALLGLDSSGGAHQWAGVACVIVATAGYVIGPLVVQKHLAEVDELGAIAASLLVASLVLLPLALLTAPATLPSATSLWSILILGTVCTAGALLLYFYLIGEAGAARASVVAYVCPAVAALLGVLVLGERFSAGMILAFALILLGSWMATHGPRVVRPPALEGSV
jgi:drug/metabolite transporter (DMT)-like permease